MPVFCVMKIREFQTKGTVIQYPLSFIKYSGQGEYIFTLIKRDKVPKHF